MHTTLAKWTGTIYIEREPLLINTERQFIMVYHGHNYHWQAAVVLCTCNWQVLWRQTELITLPVVHAQSDNVFVKHNIRSLLLAWLYNYYSGTPPPRTKTSSMQTRDHGSILFPKLPCIYIVKFLYGKTSFITCLLTIIAVTPQWPSLYKFNVEGGALHAYATYLAMARR